MQSIYVDVGMMHTKSKSLDRIHLLRVIQYLPVCFVLLSIYVEIMSYVPMIEFD